MKWTLGFSEIKWIRGLFMKWTLGFSEIKWIVLH